MFRLIEHVPRSISVVPPYVERFDATAEDVWAAIDRLDCSDYGGLIVSPADEGWPRLDVLGCSRSGYWVSLARSSIDQATVMPNPDASGSVDIVTGNQEVDVPVRKLCDQATMNAAVQAFLKDQTAADGLPWVRTR